MERIRCFFVWFPRLNILMQQMAHSSTGAVALGHLATLQRLKSLCVSGWEPQNGNQGEAPGEKMGEDIGWSTDGTTS